MATYKRQDYAELILKHFKLDKYFDFIKGTDNEGILTKKDIMELYLKYFNINAKNTVMIGDTKHDENGALELGVDFIPISWGFGFKKEAKIANNPSEILKFMGLPTTEISINCCLL